MTDRTERTKSSLEGLGLPVGMREVPGERDSGADGCAEAERQLDVTGGWEVYKVRVGERRTEMGVCRKLYARRGTGEARFSNLFAPGKHAAANNRDSLSVKPLGLSLFSWHPATQTFLPSQFWRRRARCERIRRLVGGQAEEGE